MVVNRGKTGYREIFTKVTPVLKESGGEGVFEGMKCTGEGKPLNTLSKNKEAFENTREK